MNLSAYFRLWIIYGVVYPLNFMEYLHFCGRDEIIDTLQRVQTIQSDSLDALLPDAFEAFYRFLIYGGYPEVAQVEEREKRDVLASIFDLYVKKDLVDFLKVDRIKHAKTQRTMLRSSWRHLLSQSIHRGL